MTTLFIRGGTVVNADRAFKADVITQDGKIVTVYITRNPDKLQHVAKVLAITPPESQLRH